MGHRSRTLVAVAAVALAVATGCSEGDGSWPSVTGGGGDGDSTAEQDTIASADEVIEVVDRGFVSYRVERSSGYNTDYLSYGFVIENVSDMVALSVRVEVDFMDKAGNPIKEVSGGNDFTVVLPGQQMGAGGSKTYEGQPIADMDVKVTLISSLDTPDGDRHRDPPSPYVELETGDPVARRSDASGGVSEVVTVDVTNTYDVPVTPKATAVVRDADGVIVGGMSHNAMEQELQPGDTAKAKFPGRDIQLERLTSGITECYADPMLGWIVTRDPVWQDL